MKIRAMIVALFALAPFGIPAAIGAEGTGVESLTLDRARALALASSRTLASLGLSVESAGVDERLQRYEGLPSLTLSASASASAPAAPGLSVTDTVAAGVSVGATQTLYSGGRNRLLSGIAALSTAQAREKARAGYYACLDAVDSAWYSLLEAHATRESAEAAIRSSDASLEIANARREIGAASMADCLEAEANAASARANLGQAERDVSVYSAKLASLTGVGKISGIERPDFASYDSLVARLSTLEEEGIESIVAAIQDRALAENPALASSRLALEKAGRSVDLGKAAYLPTLSAGISTGLDYAVVNGLSDPAVRFSLTGNVPLDAWSTAASVEKSRVEERQASLGADEDASALKIDVAQALYGCVSAARTIVSSEKAVEYAEINYENRLEQYRLGAASVSELASAASLAAASRGSLIKARYTLLRSLSTLRTLGAFGSDGEVLAAMGYDAGE